MDLYFAVSGVAISQKTPEKPAGERSPSGAMPTRAPFPFESSVPRCTTSAVDGNQISYQFGALGSEIIIATVSASVGKESRERRSLLTDDGNNSFGIC